MITIFLEGTTYRRDYGPRFCEIEECGQRIQFRLNNKGVPESSYYYNKRKCCCKDHAAQLRKQRVEVERVITVSAIDKFLYGRK